VTYLLDVDVLIALIDPAYVSHGETHRWFTQKGPACWATCPITESGKMRIVGRPRYPNTPGAPAVVAGVPGRRGTRSPARTSRAQLQAR
jgi:predicted nucleic acid-binding protein